MKMRSPNPDQVVHMALTSGHTFTVGAELVEVPKAFRSMAIARGCLIEGQEPEKEEKPKPEATKHDLIVAGCKQMLEAGTKDDFTNDGKPKTDKLSALVGFTVSADERDAAWAELSDADDA